jgi:arabidopsis histidine kinase 2/3/4 (cytokinin receptor)
LLQFTERGHIFVQVHLADRSNLVTEQNPDPRLNGHNDDSIPTAASVSTNSDFDTLSGYEAADTRNTWENFKQFLSFCSHSTENGSGHNSNSKPVTLVVSVEDTGTGIPLHAQSRVFTPFMQADSSTSRNYGGTGIGLSISKCLVELMYGQIWFVSRPCIGSTFTFTAVMQRCERNGAEEMKKDSFDILRSCFRGFHAVLVDRRPVRAIVTKYHLQRLGISVETVGNVDLAIAAWTAKKGKLLSG